MTDEVRPVLQARGITKFFPGAIALADVDLSLRPGEVHALLGENGAGKSTLIKCLTGAYARDGGTLELDGAEVSPGSTEESQRLGIGTVYQEVNLLPNLTVAENLFLGRQPLRWGLVSRRRMAAEAAGVLAGYGLHIDVREPLSHYPVAVQQVIAIARAVEMSGRVLILDEPTASLDRDEVELVFSVIRKLKERGLASVFITHFLDQVFAICDRATVLRNGRVVGTRELAGSAPRDIVHLMLGRQLESEVHERHGGQGGTLLAEIDGLGRRGMIEPVSMQIREGEVIGLAGLLGAGRTETASLLFGAVQADPAPGAAPGCASARSHGRRGDSRRGSG
ncbi:sugar ABC transporter ATP-binding protein [Mangrovicoccus ximenensis]|uniref:sugar ABC transporter ATP-binding protein n=1 Tax=Mangrovicoccus ximenensis TaxID=1911570 RepID=UPI00137520F3|nr:sugar ABC transporter ATP-binding protein [Mangrovicoccus ximenensis]